MPGLSDFYGLGTPPTNALADLMAPAKNLGLATPLVNAFLTERSPSPDPGVSMRWLVWEMGAEVYGLDRDVWRRDKYGALMNWYDYGNRHSKYGWEVDHIIPRARGGRSVLSNYQPLWWRNNVWKGDHLI